MQNYVVFQSRVEGELLRRLHQERRLRHVRRSSTDGAGVRGEADRSAGTAEDEDAQAECGAFAGDGRVEGRGRRRGVRAGARVAAA